MADIEHAVHLIDQTLTAIVPHCHQCNAVLRRHGPSLDFCGDLCQTAWHQKRPPCNSRFRANLDRPALETYRATPPPGPLESLWNRITRRWRKR